MSEKKDTKQPQKRPEATTIATGPFAFLRNPKKRAIFISVVSIILVAVIVLVIVLATRPTETTPSADNEEKDARKYELIKNGDFRYALFEDEENALYTYPLAPDSWTSEVAVDAESDDKDLAGQRSKGGIVNTSTLDTASSSEVGYNAGSFDIKKPADATASDTTGGKKNTSEFSVDRAKNRHDNILMLYGGDYSKNPDSGTKSAVSFKSTSFYVNAGEYAEISVWVRTIDVTATDNVQIRIQTNEADELFFNGVTTANTANIPDIVNNGWVQYRFYISTNLTYGQNITLQLSIGYASTGTNHPYASGYAFFSDISINYINQKTFLAAEDIVENAANPDHAAYADYIKYHSFRSETGTKEIEYKNGKFDTTLVPYPSSGPVAANTLYKKAAPHAIPNVGEANIVDLDTYDNNSMANHPFPDGTKSLQIYNSAFSSFGASFEGTYLSVGINRYYKISVWVKTTEMTSGRGASIYLINKNYQSNRDRYPSVWFEGIDTTKTSTSGKDYNDGWVEYSFYIQGSGVDIHDYYIELWLGKRGQVGSAASDSDRAMGYAYFANTTVSAITMAEYQNVSSGDTAKTLSVPSKSPSTSVENGVFNTPTANDLYDYPLNPSSWAIRHAGHNELRYLDENDYFEYHNDKDNPPADLLPRERDDYSAGIVNTSVSLNEILDNIVHPTKQNELRDIKKGELKAAIDPHDFWGNNDNFWDNMIAAAAPGITGPNVLMIANHTATSFGYRSNNITLSANSYYRISLKVLTFNIASGGVNIYLTGLEDFETDADGTVTVSEDKTKTNEDARFLGIDTQNKSGDYYSPNGIFEMAGTSTVDTAKGWVEYSILVATGDNEKTVNLELWLGGRGYTDDRAEGKNGKSCYAFFDNVRLDTFEVEEEHPDHDHDHVNEFENVLDKLGIDLEVADFNTKYNNLKIFDYRLEVNEEGEEITAPDEEKEPFEFDWLLIPSIIIAVVLLMAVIAVLFRKLTKNIRRAPKIKPSSDYKRKAVKVEKHTDEESLEQNEEFGIEPLEKQQKPSKSAPEKSKIKEVKTKPDAPEIVSNEKTDDSEL